MLNQWPRWRDWCLNLLFPLNCFNCGLAGEHFCENCLQKLNYREEICLTLALANKKTKTLEKIYAAGDLNNSILHKLIIKYKYNFISALKKPLARFLIGFWQTKVLTSSDFLQNQHSFLVIPIPLTPKRYRWRGFNQAELVAREFSKYFNYPASLDLKRIRHGRPQATLKETERFANIKSAFVWRGENLNKQSIILLDDVATTGATLAEAARVLKEAGAREVYGLVIAKG